jgi:NitT/TauT family transport system substrate-binding protein
MDRASGRGPLVNDRQRAGLRVVLTILLAVTACSSPPPEGERAQLRVGFTRRLTMSPLLIAQAEGYFAEEGLDVDLVPIGSASTGLPALLQGRLDVLPGPVSAAFFNAIHRGGRLRLVADKGTFDGTDCSHNGLVLSTAATQGENPPEIQRLSTAGEHFLQFFVERALEANGYDPHEIEMLHVPQAAEYDALMTGGLDAAFVGEPWYTLLRDRGGRVIAPANELFDGYQYSVILYGPSLLDGDQAVGERFAVALLRGLRRYDEGKTERNLDALAEVMGQDRDELADLCWPSMGSDGFIDIPSLMEFQAWAVERGDQDAIVPPEAFWEPRFVELANQLLEERIR